MHTQKHWACLHRKKPVRLNPAKQRNAVLPRRKEECQNRRTGSTQTYTDGGRHCETDRHMDTQTHRHTDTDTQARGRQNTHRNGSAQRLSPQGSWTERGEGWTETQTLHSTTAVRDAHRHGSTGGNTDITIRKKYAM